MSRSRMHVAFLYNEFAEDPAFGTGPEQPVDFAPADALRRLGHDVTLVAATLDLADLRRRLRSARPDVVFNRVESLGGSDAASAAATLLLDAMRLPYTGCATEALVATANKLSAKQRLLAAGLPTPDWIDLLPSPSGIAAGGEGMRYILKSVLEHASFQMDDGAVFAPPSVDDVRRRIADRQARWGRPHFAERYVDGREFNLSLLAGQVLPPAEIDFSAFSDGRPRIVGQRAKCDAASFEYHHTPRRFDFPPADRPLVEHMSQLALACWHLFGLEGFARVDFRCDRQGRPWILEINANPCLERTSGFAAALDAAGIGYDAGIQRLVDDALARAEGGRGKGEGNHSQRGYSPRSSLPGYPRSGSPRSSLPPSTLPLPP